MPAGIGQSKGCLAVPHANLDDLAPKECVIASVHDLHNTALQIH